MRVSRWCLLPLHHSKDLPVSAIVRARDRRKDTEVAPYRKSEVGTRIGEHPQLQGGSGEGRSSLQENSCPTALIKGLECT